MWRGALSAEWLKQRRTGTWLLVVAPPVTLVLVLAWYLSRLSVGDPFAWLNRTVLEGWSSLFVPMGAALLAGLAAHREVPAGNWVGLRTRPVSPLVLYGAKLLILFLQALGSTALLVGGTLLGGVWAASGSAVHWHDLAAASAVVLLASLPLLVLHLWLAAAKGLGASLAVGGGGVLIASLIGGTSLGNGIWQVVPWAWPVRVAAGVLTGDWARTASVMLLVAGFSIPLLVGSLYWFSQWEGKAPD